MDEPRYFNLLSDREVEALGPVLTLLRDRREAVLDRWYELYLRHFGPTPLLGATVFREVYGRDLDTLVDNLLDRDMEGFASDMRTLGVDLVERDVPFAEVVASLHLFEESAGEQFHKGLDLAATGPGIYQTFDKLSHCRIIVLASSYFAGHHAVAAARLGALEQDAARLAGDPARRGYFHGLVGASAAMTRMYAQITAVATAQGAVLVAGESGTGKELVARALHAGSRRCDKPFIAVNCAALPKELIESELFGHRRGAYTGATGEYAGLIRSASGGTLFLDEVTEMAAETQAKLLRVLEERAVRPVGTPREIPVDVRFVASTNRRPDEAVAAGILRSDLFYRLAVHRIAVPPLRERVDDIPALVSHFCTLLAGLGLRAAQRLDDDALATLRAYPWPGNVRELRSAVEHALTLGQGDCIRRPDLPDHVLQGATLSPAPQPAATPGQPIPSLEQAERELIVRALEATGGNRLQAARLLRISRHKLYDRLRKLGL